MRKIYYLSFLLLFANVSLFAQEIKISGKVIATDNSPLQGVTVTVAGTKNQTTTNADGMYSISMPNNAGELTFTYIKSRSITEKINGRTPFDLKKGLQAHFTFDKLVNGFFMNKFCVCLYT